MPVDGLCDKKKHVSYIHETSKDLLWLTAIRMSIFDVVRGGADKSLARPISRCRRTESIVSLEREVCSCAELQVFSCYRG